MDLGGSKGTVPITPPPLTVSWSLSVLSVSGSEVTSTGEGLSLRQELRQALPHLVTLIQQQPPHSTDEEPEVQRDQATCPRSHSQKGTELGFEVMPVLCQSPCSFPQHAWVRLGLGSNESHRSPAPSPVFQWRPVSPVWVGNGPIIQSSRVRGQAAPTVTPSRP